MFLVSIILVLYSNKTALLLLLDRVTSDMETNKTIRYSSGRVGEKYFKQYFGAEKYADWWCVLWTSAGPSYDCVLAKKVIIQLYVLSELASTKHQAPINQVLPSVGGLVVG